VDDYFSIFIASSPARSGVGNRGITLNPFLLERQFRIVLKGKQAPFVT
jgi:hypothetical protein